MTALEVASKVSVHCFGRLRDTRRRRQFLHWLHRILLTI